jgi:hypothetical protein
MASAAVAAAASDATAGRCELRDDGHHHDHAIAAISGADTADRTT